MLTVRRNRLTDFVRRRAVVGNGDVTDGELLDDFIACKDEAAFVELLRRHGPMVLGVCRRMLGSPHDAEDAFQATFLILLRKADRVWPRGHVGRWLYGVAYRTALKARATAKRRRDRERLAGALRQTGEAVDAEQRARLDREITRLPEKYRSAVILCELEGVPRKDAAQRLGLPEGTLSSRLAAARLRLARRLALPAAAVATLFTRDAQAVPTVLQDSLAQAALDGAAIPPPISTLVGGVMTSMWLNQFKLIPVALVLIMALAAGLAGRPDPALAGGPDDAKKQKKEVGPTVHGTVTAADAEKGTLTLAVRVAADKKQTEEKSFALPKDVTVILQDTLTKDESPPIGKVADLTPGTAAEVQLSPDGKRVVEIRASGPGLQGGVKSVDASANTITVHVKDKDGASERTLQLARGAKILLSDGLNKSDSPKEGSLGDLSEGTRVSIRLSVDRKMALGVHVQGAVVHGQLKGLDTDSNTLTVTYKGDGQVVEKTYTLAKGAHVDSGVQAGSTVTITVSVFDKTVATSVHVHEKK